MDRYTKLKRNTIIFTIGSMSSSVITFILLPLLTNKLNPTQYGTIDFINITITLLMPVLSINIIEAILRFGVDKDYNDSGVLSTSLIIAIISISGISCILFFIFIIVDVEIKNIYIILLISVGLIYQIFQTFCRSINRIKEYAIADILYAIMLGGFNFIFIIKFDMGVNGYYLAYIGSNLLAIIFLFFKAKIYKYIAISKFNYNYCTEFIKYSVPLIPNTLSWWIIDVSDRYLVTMFLGMSSLGIYSIANKIPSIIKIIYSMFFKAWQISSIEEFDNQNSSEFYTKIFNYLIRGMFFIAIVILACIPFIMNYFIGSEFYDSIYYMPIIILAIVIYTFSAFLGTIYTAKKETKAILKTTIISSLINIIINVMFIRKYGIIIAAVSTLVSYIYLVIHRYIDTKKYINIKIDYFNLMINLFLILIQAIIIWSGMSWIIKSTFCVIVLFSWCFCYRNEVINIYRILKLKVIK